MGSESQAPRYVQAFQFRVEIPAIDDGIGFQEASGFASEFTVVEQPEGGSLTNEKNPGKRNFDDLTLKRGASTGMGLWNWHESLGDAVSNKGEVPVDKRAITVRLIDKDNTTLKRIVFHEAWPMRYVPGDLDANNDSENQIEEVVFSYRYFEILEG